jgi:hypothetical protein
MNTAILILLIGATYRSAYLVVYERGPWALAEKLRSWVVKRYSPKSWQGEGIQCMLCVSFWLALGWTVVALAMGALGIDALLLTWWGVAGLAMMLHVFLLRGRP